MKKLLYLLPLLLAGCQSERVAFRFRPVAPTANATPTTAPVVASLAPRVAAAPKPAQHPVQQGSKALAQAVTISRLRSAPRAAQVETTALAATPVSAAPLPARLRPLLLPLRRQHATAGPARTTENGLGGIFFFFLALALALLAGLGALVSLIPGVSFWGGVGLVAGGMLLLSLLVGLFSGGKKKKK